MNDCLGFEMFPKAGKAAKQRDGNIKQFFFLYEVFKEVI